MSETDTKAVDEALVFESDLDAPPETVWRAVVTPELRERWLPGSALADREPVSATPGEEVGYRMRDDEPPFLESTVIFQLRPGIDGAGTRLRIVHRLSDERLQARSPVAANSNRPALMLAA